LQQLAQRAPHILIVSVAVLSSHDSCHTYDIDDIQSACAAIKNFKGSLLLVSESGSNTSEEEFVDMLRALGVDTRVGAAQSRALPLELHQEFTCPYAMFMKRLGINHVPGTSNEDGYSDPFESPIIGDGGPSATGSTPATGSSFIADPAMSSKSLSSSPCTSSSSGEETGDDSEEESDAEEEPPRDPLAALLGRQGMEGVVLNLINFLGYPAGASMSASHQPLIQEAEMTTEIEQPASSTVGGHSNQHPFPRERRARPRPILTRFSSEPPYPSQPRGPRKKMLFRRTPRVLNGILTYLH
jgi:hypothetical protein